MAKFLNSDIASLANQLTRSPRRLRMDQIHGIESLLRVIAADRVYPYDFVCYHITKYRSRGPTTGASIPGNVLLDDLTAMAEFLSREANMPAADVNEPFRTQQEVAEQLGVSTKTIRRWRRRGLMGLRIVFADGVNRLAFLQRSVDWFVARNRELVSRGASFTQLTDTERNRIVERTRELLSTQTLKLHTAARLVASETNRAVETVRYTLRRYDEANPQAALFTQRDALAPCERYAAMWRCRQSGEPITAIAEVFDCPTEDVEAALRQVDVHRWMQTRWEPVPNELFDAPNADALILDVPEPPAQSASDVKIPSDLPPYLRCLYRTPLLTRDLERDLFRRYNYLKSKVAKLLASVEIDSVTEAQHLALGDLIEQVNRVKQRIIRANLRLVVSIAKKHVGWSPRFFEVVSDGNMSLMRAVERFDFARGNRFSTYATWAIMKNFARTIPREYYHGARFVTGQDELLSRKADAIPETTTESDRHRVRELIAEGLRDLPERDREIVSCHFGLDGRGSTSTLEQLGRRFGVTKERIRQIEQRALGRLRDVLHPSLVEAIGD